MYHMLIRVYTIRGFLWSGDRKLEILWNEVIKIKYGYYGVQSNKCFGWVTGLRLLHNYMSVVYVLQFLDFPLPFGVERLKQDRFISPGAVCR